MRARLSCMQRDATERQRPPFEKTQGFMIWPLTAYSANSTPLAIRFNRYGSILGAMPSVLP